MIDGDLDYEAMFKSVSIYFIINVASENTSH